MSRSRDGRDERSPLLQRNESNDSADETETIDFKKDDEENPRAWSKSKKLTNVAVISLMAILSPLASSMFTPGIAQIGEDLGVSVDQVIGATTGFVVLLGIGPLILAPLSETFGRRILYLTCFSIFTLLQIPTALSPNIATLVAIRTISGFFGSVGVANGGGTISDMFEPSERSGVFGWYLLGPLMGPTLGPLFGGFIVKGLGWRWIFWILTIICSINTLLGFFFLRETYAPIILAKRYEKMSSEEEHGKKYTYAGQDTRPLREKLWTAVKRPVRILFTQPIVFTMAAYQAIIFATMYSLFTNMQEIFGKEPYNFDTNKVGLLYLGPGVGFLIAVLFIVPQIDKIFNKMTKDNGGEEKPEYRLPLANIGAVLLPVTLFWFAWTVEYRVHWFPTILATTFYGIGQVTIFNTVQNYYIDAFAQYAASAIAAGSVARSVVGGVVPLFAGPLFEKLGYGWGWSVFAFLTLALSPSPLLFMRYGEWLRHKFAIDL